MKLRTGLILTALFYCAGAQATHPQLDSRVVSTFGMIGISHYETARLNLVNIDDPKNINIIANLCQAQLRFLDREGKVLTKSDVILANGHAGYLDFAQDKTPDANRRIEIRAEVATLDTLAIASAANCIATIEIFNSRTGRTSAVYPAAPQLNLGGFVVEPPLPPLPPPLVPQIRK